MAMAGMPFRGMRRILKVFGNSNAHIMGAMRRCRTRKKTQYPHEQQNVKRYQPVYFPFQLHGTDDSNRGFIRLKEKMPCALQPVNLMTVATFAFRVMARTRSAVP
jgi:hypothetical protein